MLGLKEDNHKRVLRIIRARRGVSGADLARTVNLRPSSLTYILRHLETLGLIFNSGQGTSSAKGGKKPNLWKIMPEAGYLVGFEIVKTQIRCVLVSLKGEIILRLEKAYTDLDASNIVCYLLSIIEEIKIEIPQINNKLLHISVAFPGVTCTEYTNINYSIYSNLTDVKLSQAIINSTGVPVNVINNAQAGALTEKWYNLSTKKEIKSLVHINYNPYSGIAGWGIVANSNLITGKNNLSGQVINLTPTIEKWYISTLKLNPEVESLYRNGSPTIQEISKKSQENCKITSTFISEVNNFLQSEFYPIIKLLNPSLISIGGELTTCKNWPIDALKNNLSLKLAESTSNTLPLPDIKLSEQGVFCSALGATGLFLEKFLQ